MRLAKLFLFGVVLLFVLPATMRAATFTSAASGNWTTSTIGSPAGVPGAGDDVIIQSGHSITISATHSAASLTMNGAGILTGSGSLTVASFVWNDGSLSTGGGSLTVTGSMSIATASNNHTISGFTLNNQGTATWASGAGEFRLNASGAIFNNSGTFDIQTDAGILNFAA